MAFFNVSQAGYSGKSGPIPPDDRHMLTDSIGFLDKIALDELEVSLDAHTLEQVEPDKWTRFSWSVSRHQTFARCKREYYLNYYGSRRVREAESKFVSAVWWLKQITALQAWIGTVIHHIAATAVRAQRDGTPLNPDQLVAQATRYYREGFRASERGAKHEDHWILLFEHAYPGQPFSIDRDAAEARVVDLTRTLLESDAFTLIASLPPEAIREVDEPFQSFDLMDVPVLGKTRVFAIPDVLVQDENGIAIIDWKTGDAAREDIRWQAGVYRLYAHSVYKAPEDSVRVLIADLGESGANLEPPGGTPTLAESGAFVRPVFGPVRTG